MSRKLQRLVEVSDDEDEVVEVDGCEKEWKMYLEQDHTLPANGSVVQFWGVRIRLLFPKPLILIPNLACL